MRFWRTATSRVECMRIMRVLQDHLDGTLDEVATRRVAAHLEDCRRCGLEASVYSEIKAALKKKGARVDPDTVDRLRQFGARLAEGDEPVAGDHGA